MCSAPNSGGARVFAARGKRMCCRPRQSDQLCNRFFQDLGHGGVNQPLGSLLFPCLPFCPLSHLPTIRRPFFSSPLEIGPLDASRRSGSGVCSSRVSGAKPQPKLNFVHFSLKI